MPEPYDRWHKTHPKPGEKPCSAHDKVPSAKHGRGKRWAARWLDPDGEPQESLFDKRPDAVQHLNKVSAATDAGTYVAPRNGWQVEVHRTAWKGPKVGTEDRKGPFDSH